MSHPQDCRCAVCSGGIGLDEYHRTAALNIYRRGQHLVGVFDPDGRDPPYTYTIGNYEKELPEILQIGAPSRQIGWALNTIGERQRQSGLLLGVIDLGGDFPVKLVDVTDIPRVKRDFTIQVGVHYRTADYRVTQLYVPDKKGRFPDEKGCAAPYRWQVLRDRRQRGDR